METTHNQFQLIKGGVVVARIVAVVLVLGVTAVGMWMYLNGYLGRSKASEVIANASFAPATATIHKGDTAQTLLNITSTNGISGIDAIVQYPSNAVAPHISTLPTGFDDQIVQLSPAGTNSSVGTVHLVYVAKKTTTALPKSASITLAFEVLQDMNAQIDSTLHVTVKNITVVGDAPNMLFTVQQAATPLDFQMSYPTLPTGVGAQSVTDLSCIPACGTKNVGIMWTGSPNADGYKVTKDGGTQPLATLSKDATTYRDNTCDETMHTYRVIAYNAVGSQSTTDPSVQCSCTSTCPPSGPVIPTPMPPLNSADLIFQLNFPDATAAVQTIPNVKVEIYNGAILACPNCSQIVTFVRNGSYFQSPQLSFDIADTAGQLISYDVLVKQIHTIKRKYQAVYLKRQVLLQCSMGGSDSRCGQLRSLINEKPLLSGDMDGFDSQAAGFNIIDETDLSRVQEAVTGNSPEGDMNFDGITNTNDISVVGRNYNKKGD